MNTIIILHELKKMLNEKKRLIDKKYVHKTKDENVLVYNLRRALPVKINKNIFENEILKSVNKEEKKLLLNYYIQHFNKNYISNPQFYIMYNIPHIIEKEYLKDLIKEKKIIKEDLKSLFQYYNKDKENNHYILKKEISEIDEINILKTLKKKDLQIFDFDNREIISSIFEKIVDFQKEDIFFANMLADKTHMFFFEHSVEHVPAMMTIEASRQFFIAICHIYGKIPLEGISFILSGIQVDFKNYLELNYPIKMIAEINKKKARKDGSWKEIDTNIYFYQNNIKSVVINYKGRSISNEMFKHIRKTNFNYKVYPRFSPSGMYYKNLSLKNNNKKFLYKIIDISDSGFQLEVEDKILINDDKIFEFFIFFQEIGFIHGKCELRWHTINNDKLSSSNFRAGFKIVEMDEDDKANFKEAIKRFCYVKLEREYL